MPKINVYLPDELADAVKAAKVPVSVVCQRALEQAVRNMNAISEGSSMPVSVLGSYGRFSGRARTALELAKGQADQRGHSFIGTEHVLLGILEEGNNLAIAVLASLEIGPGALWSAVEQVMGPAAPDQPASKPLDRRLTPLAQEALKQAERQALELGHNYIGCEHLLLGLIREPEGLAGGALRSLGADVTAVKRATVAALAGVMAGRAPAAPAPPPPAPPPPAPPPSPPSRPGIESKLDQILSRLEALEARLPPAS
jgi:ATP-dependent Clp protease ATP-binding subunit ClpC